MNDVQSSTKIHCRRYCSQPIQWCDFTPICSEVVDLVIYNSLSKLLTLVISEAFLKEARSTKTEVKDMSETIRKHNKTFLPSNIRIFVLVLNGKTAPISAV